METLQGSVERITYYNAENGYSVIKVEPEEQNLPAADRAGLVTVTGNLPELAPGEYLHLQGQWVNHAKHGMQFNAEICEQTIPATTEGIKRYLSSGLLKGVGPKLAERIVAKFGAKTLDIIENDPQKLRQVADIGPKRVRLITQAWQEQRQVRDIMLFLHSHGVSTNLAIKIYKQYGDLALEVVQSDPYQLARDIFGVGFKTADRIAQALGLPADHPTRVEAGIVYTLEDALNNGHVFLPQGTLVNGVSELLNVQMTLIPPALERLATEELVMLDNVPLNGETDTADDTAPNAVYLTPYYYAERGVAARLSRLAAELPSRLSDIPPALTVLDPSLSPEQAQAIRTTISQPVSVLTGGPGTGKTTAIKALIAAVEAAGKKYALASPTGRAAKRLSEAADRPASTLHRLLEYSPIEGFGFDDANTLKLDLLVVDEASMLDLILANNLLKALEPGTHLLLVGDVDQLPSVGAGDVLRDIIASEIVPITRLSVIFRQAAGSHIIENAHRINQGELPEFDSESGEDFFRFPANTPEEAASWVVDLVTTRIPQRFRLNPRDDIQVLVPMYRGPAGIHNLNAELQAALNPPKALKPERTLYGQTFRSGDKVMQVKNDYDKNVFNGDIGWIKEISQVQQSLTVDYEGRSVTYDWSETDQLVLAYAISVHKSQGSEFPAIVLPLLTQHYMMLQRNLLYTAITRAKRLCVLVSNTKATAIAVKNNKVTERHTALAWRLQENR
ncbi:MAG: ATP-dependent RecD-like DNA helicase [Anaerolineales bacterium]|nr:ATP-dependent RecD-like DNA helicase [Anaerolineales bacterium]